LARSREVYGLNTTPLKKNCDKFHHGGKGHKQTIEKNIKAAWSGAATRGNCEGGLAQQQKVTNEKTCYRGEDAGGHETSGGLQMEESNGRMARKR